MPYSMKKDLRRPKRQSKGMKNIQNQSNSVKERIKINKLLNYKQRTSLAQMWNLDRGSDENNQGDN